MTGTHYASMTDESLTKVLWDLYANESRTRVEGANFIFAMKEWCKRNKIDHTKFSGKSPTEKLVAALEANLVFGKFAKIEEVSAVGSAEAYELNALSNTDLMDRLNEAIGRVEKLRDEVDDDLIKLNRSISEIEIALEDMSALKCQRMIEADNFKKHLSFLDETLIALRG